MKKNFRLVSLLLALCFLLSACGIVDTNNPSSTQSLYKDESYTTTNEEKQDHESSVGTAASSDSGDISNSNQAPSAATDETAVLLSDIPAYSGLPYIAINNNVPNFKDSDLTTKSYEFYSDLDRLGRCGVAIACIGIDLMPTEARGSIGQVKPTGWHTVKYDCVDGKYLYNRCHLIGYQLSGENANTKNLITGTRYMNVDGMLPFENMVADFVKETGYHVLYRVTPIFDGNNLLASGVQMEAFSVEDDGDGICFNVFVYNVQPQITINYATGESSYGGETFSEVTTNPPPNVSESVTYILNLNTKKFHYPYCHSVDQMKESNKEYFTGSRSEVINRGFSPCGNCKP